MADDYKDLFEYMQKMWNPTGFGMPGMPGMAAPTLDVREIEKKIDELKAVENWLRMSAGMLQMTIKTLEMQKAALETLSGKSPPAA